MMDRSKLPGTWVTLYIERLWFASFQAYIQGFDLRVPVLYWLVQVTQRERARILVSSRQKRKGY